MLLSHADADHIGGAVTLLLNKGVQIKEVFLNPDASKESFVFEQLRYALAEAQKRSNTRIEPSLTTSTSIRRKGATIEVLHPQPEIALSGVGGKSKTGNRYTSNSLSAAIRVTCGLGSSVLLGGDIEFSCLDEWKTHNVRPSAWALVFPHHGGLPGSSGDSEVELFAHEITRLVNPKVVIFSIHRTQFPNPREKVLKAILKAAKGISFACTQLPEHLHPLVTSSDNWSLHKSKGSSGILEGPICLEFLTTGIHLSFGDAP